MAIERMSGKLSPFALNTGKMALSLIVITLFLGIAYGNSMTAVPREVFISLFLSGLVGFAIGDVFLFMAFVEVGSKITLLIFSLSPVFAGLVMFLFKGEQMTAVQFIGVTLSLTGVAIVVMLGRGKDSRAISTRGLVFALLAMVGQALGVILSKTSLADIDPMKATQIRLIGGLVGMTVILALFGRFKDLRMLKLKKSMTVVFIAGFFGTFIGVSMSMLALKLTNTAVASTLMSMSPILIIPLEAVFFKVRPTLRETLGILTSFIGIVLLII